MPPPLLRLVPEIERAIGKGPDLEPGSPADLNHFADGKQVLVLHRSLVDVAARIKFDGVAKHVILLQLPGTRGDAFRRRCRREQPAECRH